MSQKKAEQHCKQLQVLEFDCEMRVQKLIKKYDIAISLKNHIQWVNYTMWMYTMMLETRKWTDDDFDWTQVKKYVPKDRYLTPKEWSAPTDKFRETYLRYNK
jgi:hypothetical protein